MHKQTAFCIAFAALALTACSGGGGSTTSTSPPPPPPPPAQSPQSETDVVYGTGLTNGGSKTLLLDVYQSGDPCTTPRPLVILIHGGGFAIGSKNTGSFPAIAQELADRGYVAISINYRLEGDDPLPSAEFMPVRNGLLTTTGTTGDPDAEAFSDLVTSAFEDATNALRWAESNATARCIDTNNVALWGSSAGAVIAMQVAYGLDEYSIALNKPEVVIDYWGQLIQRDVMAANDPPLFILHGDQDPTVAYAEALLLRNEALAADLDFSFYTVANAGHSFSSIPINSVLVDGVSIKEVTYKFLDDHLKSGTPVYETRTLDLP